MTARALLACALACLGTHAAALETATWPPPDTVASRMKELQEVLRDPQATPEQRDAARAELARLLKRPAGQSRATPDEKRPARAAVAPLPPLDRRSPDLPTPPPPPPTGVARLEVVETPRPSTNPRTGSLITPLPDGFAIDSRTGAVLREVPGGYVDPRTGRLIPR